MLRFFCKNCQSKFRGGAEDTECPVCGSRQITIIGVGYK